MFVQDETSGNLVRSIHPLSSRPGHLPAADGMAKVAMLASNESGRDTTPDT